jgi:flagellar capping protein FliD
MKHIKRFNESADEQIKNEIEQSVENCFLDYLTDYGMLIQFVEGYYVPGYNFMSERFLKELIKKYPDETTKFQGKNEKCIKVDFHNEGIGRVEDARLNIYLDENSQTLFDESIHNLKAELKMITNSFRLEDLPKELSPDFFGINFLIIYE